MYDYLTGNHLMNGPRSFDRPEVVDDGDGFDSQFLGYTESCGIVRTIVEPGCSGPGLHQHSIDQIYLTLAGELTAQLGTGPSATSVLKPHTVVLIPAGLPHRSWNSGSVQERHLEIFAPCLAPWDRQGFRLVDAGAESAEVPPGLVRPIRAEEMVERSPGFRGQQLLNRKSGSAHAAMNAIRQDPGSGGPGTHYHPFEQCYFVLEGEIVVDMPGITHVVRRHELIVIPAGVPHRQRSGDSVPSLHVAVNTPEPASGSAVWDNQLDVKVGAR